ncbi:MAG: diguanylate cyclase [Aquabacterium sp.]|uniref:GGDEF domain-containing protein n=1 Tax=Aquabacterium sp. TaxID=1872578 RepID=UPI003BCF84CE
MMIDLPTLLLALTVTSGVLSVAVLAVAVRSRGHHGLAMWGWGLVVNALSYPAFGLRAWGWVTVSILLTNLLTALTLVCHASAVAAFQSGRARPIQLPVVWGLLAANVLVAWTWVHDDPTRNVLVALIQAGLAGVLLNQAWGPGLVERRLTGRWVMIFGASTLVLALLVRTGVMWSATRWSDAYKVPDHVQALTYLATLMVLLVNSMGFVLMQMEYALSQQRSLAIRDGLTGVHNRRALLDALQKYGARSHRDSESMALLMIDIDHFKAVNDQFGHLAGDEVLREVVRRISHRLRQSDLLARFGGEEFVVVLPDTSVDGACTVANDIRMSIGSMPVLVGQLAVPVTVSIGVHAGIPAAATEGTDALLAASDAALYRAKELGRDRVAVA